MFLNNEKENTYKKYNFLTELKITKSSSHSKLKRKFKLIKINETIKRRARSKSRSNIKDDNKKINKKEIVNRQLNDEIIKKRTFEYKFKVIFGKIYVKKKYLQELAKRKKLYSEKIKNIKIIKRNESVKPKEDSSYDIIKRYSLKVLYTNRANMNYQKEKERELFEKLDNIDKSNLNSAIFETPQIKQKLKLTPFFKKLNIINNNLIPLFPNNLMVKNKSYINIEESTKFNFGSNSNNNNDINLSKKYEIVNNKSLDKNDIINKSTTDIINVKSNNKRSNISNLKIIINDSSKTKKSIDNSPKIIEINILCKNNLLTQK